MLEIWRRRILLFIIILFKYLIARDLLRIVLRFRNLFSAKLLKQNIRGLRWSTVTVGCTYVAGSRGRGTRRRTDTCRASPTRCRGDTACCSTPTGGCPTHSCCTGGTCPPASTTPSRTGPAPGAACRRHTSCNTGTGRLLHGWREWFVRHSRW